ncbi:MAG TPA: peptidylprolyl isomerase [Planctomycetota bacterium]|nr:peptidylprolyl isomerase [Planctomycetota bacterium]
MTTRTRLLSLVVACACAAAIADLGAAETAAAATSSRAIIHTPRGDIHVQLFPEAAPKTVANFIKLTNAKFYDGLSFHRVEPGFVIQGGCPNSREGAKGQPGTGGPGYTIPCECDPKTNPEKHTPGTLSMAHAGKDTGGSQFFVTHAATPHLDGRHTVFGRIESPKDLEVVLKVQRGDRFTVTMVADDAAAK